MPADDLVRALAAPASRADRLTHVRVVPAREAQPVEWPEWTPPEVRAAYERRGVRRPWSHQIEAASAAWHGEHVVLATGTASGKSLGFALPALSAVLAGRGARGSRGASVLYLAPTKALAHDQLGALGDLGLSVRAATHDGDSGHEERDWNRDHAEYLLTNPDMLHRSLLPQHERWAGLWRSLRFVVVDECHHYRGVFGAHVAQVLRRLRRVAAAHGASPTFVLASATVAEPEQAAYRLTGLPVRAITRDGSPHGAVAVGLWEPPLTSFTDDFGAPVRRSAASETAELLADLVTTGTRTLAFVRSRRGVEQVAASTAQMLADVDPGLPSRVAAYRGGYLPEERREIETQLRSGALLGLAATNALELGIDVSGLDAVLLAGFAGTRAGFWQQVGRAGRDLQDATALLVARDDPLDTYLVHHPEALFDRPVEASVFDPANPHVLGPHLAAAAQEIPLTSADLELFGATAANVVDALVGYGLLRRRPRGWFWTSRDRACDLTDLRSTGGTQCQLVEEETGRVVGTVDGARVHSTAHEGAVYVHRGETYVVTSLDLDEHVAVLRRRDPGYTTSARESFDVRLVEERAHQMWGESRLATGRVEVTSQVTSFLRRAVPGGEVIGEELLDLPEQRLETTGVWWTVPDDAWQRAGLDPADLPGAAHAAEHCSIGLLPLFATCDRWDIGGVSTARHPDTGQLTVVVHDGHPGGAGFAERGYATAAAWLRATLETIRACECVDGCPSCVQSPKCGNQNNPLDKAAAVRLLEVLLADAPPAAPEAALGTQADLPLAPATS
ncbi:DEAD/DEAH box helicase [Nocardioides acrostichi]|uniref:DEAD/DEAH box helicase n=1 Tax=Nocardioides acrostichi TaxID=2784339 RepID=A0A930V0R4_9ACTN|nr:DEAD/DEAH box helicase [Nocardioides acrostichi]MBF4163257.1 DEAD/DEAH box helicase [Nocardioides acrostichi]